MECVITNVNTLNDGRILLGFKPVFSARVTSKREGEPDEDKLKPDRILVGPSGESEDQRMVRQMVSAGMAAMQQNLDNLMKMAPGMLKPDGELPLASEEYARLGSPGVGRVLVIEVNAAAEPVVEEAKSEP